MAQNVTHFNVIKLPDGRSIDLNKVYSKGQRTLSVDATFLPYIASTFGGTSDPTAMASGKTITMTGTIKKEVNFKQDNDDRNSRNTDWDKNIASIHRVYKIGESAPLNVQALQLIDSVAYKTIAYQNIIAQKTSEHRDMVTFLARKRLLTIMTEGATNYKPYRANGVDGQAVVSPSRTNSVTGLIAEIPTKWVVGNGISETTLTGRDGLIKVFNAIASKFSNMGITVDANHPSVIAGVPTSDLLCITTRDIINEIPFSDRITQIVTLPAGIETEVTKVAGIQIVEDPLVATMLNGKARLIFIRKSAYGYVKGVLAGFQYEGSVTQGTNHSTLVQQFDGTTDSVNVKLNQSLLYHHTTYHTPQLMNGMVTVVRVA